MRHYVCSMFYLLWPLAYFSSLVSQGNNSSVEDLYVVKTILTGWPFHWFGTCRCIVDHLPFLDIWSGRVLQRAENYLAYYRMNKEKRTNAVYENLDSSSIPCYVLVPLKNSHVQHAKKTVGCRNIFVYLLLAWRMKNLEYLNYVSFLAFMSIARTVCMC